jgi:hypothetical protein
MLPLCGQHVRWLRGIVTHHATKSCAGRNGAPAYERATGLYYVCLGEEVDFMSKEEAIMHFDDMERNGIDVPYIATPLDLETMERNGDVEYVDLHLYPQPARKDVKISRDGLHVLATCSLTISK